MLNVSNKSCIRRLGVRSMRAARTRNIIAVLAIALTAMLFTSLFTIAASINYSFQQENFRQSGGDGHGVCKDVSAEEVQLLRDDPLIVDSWARLFLGMPSDPPFNKSHVEVSYIEPNGAPHYFCDPVEGTLPQEGTHQAAADTHVLALLGVEPEIGAEFTLSFYIDTNTRNPQLITRTFTLSGWWEYDSAVVASHVLLPRSAAEEIAALSAGGDGSMTGRWDLIMMFKNSRHIEEDIAAVLANHGYQSEDTSGENYVRTGVNWGYSGAQFSNNLDFSTMAAIVVLLLLIIFTGYLIIYNVFQISVSNDIRFYGLLKTIGTTGKQIKRIIRQQALLLSAAGIPIGLVLGFLTGNKLTPVIMSQLSYKNVFVSFSPLIFIGASLFALITVFLSCAKPGRMAAKVSPVEAVRYTENSGVKQKNRRRKTASGASLPRMAWANLGRSRGKTAVTVISLTLAVVLAVITYTFANGFDMDKYLKGRVVTDFIVAHANQFQPGSGGFASTDQVVPEEVIGDITAQGGITEDGRVYGATMAVKQFMPEEFYRQDFSKLYGGDALEAAVNSLDRREDGMVLGDAQLYGMDDFPLSKLNVLEGSLEPLSDPSQNAIAAAYYSDDYGETVWDTNWLKPGDTVTLRYVDEWCYIDTDTGEEISVEESDIRFERGETNFAARAKVYREQTYTVCALVEIPDALSYRFNILGASELILGAERFRQDSGMDSAVMLYAFNTTEESNAAMEDFLASYTESVQPIYDYESKQSKIREFEGFRSMFLTMGGALSFVIGLVGVLNFINAVLTGILSRKRELAVLQSVGMTGKQLKAMLVYEGLYYTVLSMLASLALTVCLGPIAGNALNSVFWFFTYRLTLLPLFIVLPLFVLLGVLTPLVVYRYAARATIVERLREADN